MKGLFLIGAAVLCCVSSAEAAVEVQFVSLVPCDTTNPICVDPASQFDYIYQANISPGTMLSNVNSGPDQIPGTGDDNAPQFFTIFDVPGFLSATTTSALTDWSVHTALVNDGPATSSVKPCALNTTCPNIDDSAVINVTFRYDGVVPIIGPIMIFPFVITATGYQTIQGAFASQNSRNTPGSPYTDLDLIGYNTTTVLPAGHTPEPVSMGLMALGVGSFALLRKRLKK